MKQSHGPAGARIGDPGGGGGGFSQMSDKNAVQVGAGRLEGEAAEDRPVETHQFEPGEVGGPVEDRFQNGQEG
ncbi:MAG: hypothetical protein ACK559_04435, partial [bacterium]